MQADTIIFDLDGTLLDTIEDIATAINVALDSFGYSKHTTEEIKSYVGNGIKTAIKKAIPQETNEETINNIIKIFKQYYQENMYVKTCPYTGVIEMLSDLKKRGYKIGVVSNKYDDAVKQLCQYYFQDYIQSSIGEGYGIERKPNPKGILKSIKELNSNIEKVIYIGDSEVDIATAKNAQIPCISVLWGFKDRTFLEQAGGKIFANTPEEIIKIIEKNLYLS